MTTLQKFPVIAREIGALSGQRFAVIVDEAHSSQTGESTKSLKAVLASPSLEEAEREEAGAETPEEELENAILAEIQKRGPLPNLSIFAFTATPKPKTLELFGRKRPDGRFEAFHVYRMRQAIEERFILDVLENYATYRAYWRLLKTIEDDPRYDRDKASSLLKSFVELHPHAVNEKIRIMVELTDYVRLYAFLAQALTFADMDLEKLYVFARHLRRLLPADHEELPREVQRNIDMESYRIRETSRGKIRLDRRVGQLEPMRSSERRGAGEDTLEPLSRIIAELNERFGLDLGPEHRITLEQIRTALDEDAGLDASARVNVRENVRLTFDPKVEDKIQEIVETNFDLYRRITDDPAFGRAIKNLLFDDYIRRHRRAEELIGLQESKSLEFKSSLRWNLREDRKDDRDITHTALKTIAAFLNTEGGDLLLGVADDRTVVGIEHDRLENDDQFMRHLTQVVRNGLGDRAGTCIDPRTQIVQGKTVCLVSCQRSPEPVFLKWKGIERHPDGDFYVRTGPGSVRLERESAAEYMRTRFPGAVG